ncbi:hypothetical protein L596_019587 [Steinernema carpocapsae]|uniref:Uncharacterized protein n=1 Tax=Steinernema carpocapsae TaxID=34508 RepID=A0A4U5MR14_STECR|nr:hypothetical protein L596_019587 [Steinernema carpocapsae]
MDDCSSPPKYRSGLLSSRTALYGVALVTISMGILGLYHNIGSSHQMLCNVASGLGIALGGLAIYAVQNHKPSLLNPFLAYFLVIFAFDFVVVPLALFGSMHPDMVCAYAKQRDCEFDEIEQMRVQMQKTLMCTTGSAIVSMAFAIMTKKAYNEIIVGHMALPNYARFK